jgi:hypothetical protein
MVTIGGLSEQLYQPPLPVALELEQTLAWATVLRALPPDQLTPLIPIVPEPESIGPWVDLGGTLRRLHALLAANQLSFAAVAQVTETEGERVRWELLGRIFDGYLVELADAELCDPNVARRQAIEDGTCATDKTITLIGTSDLSDAMLRMLESIDTEVLTLIAAPENAAERFDQYGCVVTNQWLDHHLPVTDDQFIAAGHKRRRRRSAACSKRTGPEKSPLV